MPATTDLHASWAALARACLSSPARVPLDPAPEHARALIDDLEHLECRFRSLVQDYGQAAAGIPGYDPDYTRQALDLIDDGLAQMCGALRSAAEQMEEDELEGAA